jgi:hypothetical protein
VADRFTQQRTLAAAALLIEGALRSIVTLNYDLALQTALAEHGAPAAVSICAGPEDHAKTSGRALIYLHRSVEAPEDRWIIRQSDLDGAWRDAWEGVVAAGNLAAPATLFAGLGSPAAVLTETVGRLAAATSSAYYYADPRPDNAFLAALRPHLRAVLQLGWCDLMQKLSERVAREQLLAVRSAAIAHANELALTASAEVCVQILDGIDLVSLGRLRAQWLLGDKRYLADAGGTEQKCFADLLLGLAELAGMLTAECGVDADGLVTLRAGERVVTIQCAHGGGTRPWGAVDARLRARDRGWGASNPRNVLVAGLSSQPDPLVGDLIRGETADDLIRGAEERVPLSLSELRSGPAEDPEALWGRLVA